MHTLRVIGLLFLAAIGSVFYWKLGLLGGLLLLLFVTSMAIVGQGNRLLWLAILPLLSCAIATPVYLLFRQLPKNPELPTLITFFVGVTVVPATILWAAAKFKSARSRSKAKGTSEA